MTDNASFALMRTTDGEWSAFASRSTLALGDLIDAAAIQALMDDFHQLVGIPMAVLDLEGRVLVGVGWQDICTRFHRANPETCKHCLESDTQLSAGIRPGEFRRYRCKNNMWDIATPIVVGDRHVGNVFSGQFFFEDESVDRDVFRRQAAQYGFDEHEYLAALDRVPRLTRHAVNTAMSFFLKLAQMLSNLSLANSNLAHAIDERNRLVASLRESGNARERQRTFLQRLLDNLPVAIAVVEGPELRYTLANTAYRALSGSFDTVVVGRTAGEVFPEFLECGVMDRLHHVLDTGEAIQLPEVEVRTRDGHAWWSVVDLPLGPEDRPTGVLIIGNDISGQVRARQRIEELRRAAEVNLSQLRAVVNSMNEGVIIADARGKVVTMNPAALRLHHYATLEEAQQRLQDFGATFELTDVDGRVISVGEWPLAMALSGQTFANHERRVLRKDTGHAAVMSYSGAPVRDNDGRIAFAVLTVRDVTQEKEAAEERERLREHADEANRLKDEFLATLSHELRTPLNAIVGWADMLVRGGLPPETVRRGYDVIYRNAQAQRDLIDDVLDVSRIMSGKVHLKPQPTDVAVPIRAAVESVLPTAAAKGVTIDTEFGGTGGIVSGDPTRLQQIFWNLLSNAVKFTPAGGRVRVSIRHVGDTIDVRVADTGIGIDPSFLPHVFERFRQRDSSSTRTHGGLGLGLSIVRHLVELHGGAVRAESRGEGQGAVFVVTLPADLAVEPRYAATHGTRRSPAFASGTCSDLTGVRVLLVDDEPDAREMAATALGCYGANVVMAASAREALNQLEAVNADVYLIDIAMPDIDGYGLIRRIRNREGRVADVPAIALTAYAREEDRRRALASGFQVHIAKPVEAQALVHAVARLCDRDGS